MSARVIRMRFDHNNPEELAEAAATVLRTHPPIVLGTANADLPWVVPVHQTTGPNGRIYWQSAHGSRHSQNLEANPRISGVLYSAGDKGEVALYLQGEAHVIEDVAELEAALKIRSGDKPPPDPATLLGESTFRLYVFIPAAAWLNDETFTKTAIDMELLRRQING
jgi:nitroimidazol reductase NimA-like FMN-containing flavoprotein (pyridoxamine 5'-phosphate oxidase superfamily)